MFSWLIEEPYKTIWISLAALATVVGVLYTIFRRKNSGMINTVNIGFTPEQHEASLRHQENRLRKEIRNAVETEEREKRTQLEIELSSVTDRFLNLQKSFGEEQKRRETVLAALDELKGEQPSAQIDRAKQQLIAGNPVAAEKLFDSIIEIGSPLLALAYYQSGQLAEGRVDYFKAMKQYRKAVNLEPDNPDYLFAAGALARTLGLYSESLPWLLKLVSNARSKESAKLLATAQHELAYLYSTTANYDKAEPLYQRALENFEIAFGNDHSSVAVTLNNLAELYRFQRHYKKAEMLYQRALKISEKVLGMNHTEVGVNLNNLAELYRENELYKLAKPLYLRALEICGQALGKDHPKVATILNNLALLYVSQQFYKLAEPLFLQALGITEKSFGKDHPEVATTLNNLALLYDSQGFFKKAEPLYQRALEIFKAAFKVGHPDIETCQSNYDELKRKMAGSSE